MNSSDLLKRQGWRGAGFSLDTENKGLAKPILTSRKSDQAGLGTKQNDFTNQWWLKAWDKKDQPTKALDEAPASCNHTLYKGFVKSTPLHGTIGGLREDSITQSIDESKRKLKTRETSLSSQSVQGEIAVGATTPKVASGRSDLSPKYHPVSDKSKKYMEDIKETKKRKHVAEPAEAAPEDVTGKKRRRDGTGSKERDESSREERRSKKKHRKEKPEAEAAQSKSRDGTEPAAMTGSKGDGVAVGNDIERSERKREHRSKEKHAASVNIESGDAMSGDAPFVIDTVGDHSQSLEIEEKTKQQSRAPPPPSTQPQKHIRKMPLANASGNKAGGAPARNLLKGDSKTHQALSSDGQQPDYQNMSIGALVRQHSARSKVDAPPSTGNPNPFQTQKEKRRSPRIIRKEARDLKQAAMLAAAREKGEPDPVFPKPLTKSEKRYERRFKSPTERKQKKIDRKLKRQEKSKAGVDERRRIEKEAFDAVEQMQQAGTMPDTSQPLDELIAEKRAELIAQACAEGKTVQGVKKPKKPKVEPERDHMGKIVIPKTEIDQDRDEEGRILLRNLPPGQQELPADFKIPKFKTLTMGIPIPNTTKRGSLKDLHRALVAAGLTKAQISAYTVKAIQEKKQMRLVKDQVRKDKREGRKRARAIKKQAKHAENAQLNKPKAKKDKPLNPAAEKRAEEKKKKKAGKEQTLTNNTGVILARKMVEKRALGNNEPATALEIKQSRREARKLVRLAKKGRLTAEEVPENFRLKRSQKLKLVGNGGRIPKWTAPEIWANVESARREAIAAADRDNQPKETQ